MKPTSSFSRTILKFNTTVFAFLAWAQIALADVNLTATHTEQSGKPPEGAAQTGMIVLANEPDGGKSGMYLDFDLRAVAQKVTPLARLQVKDVVKLKVKHTNQKSTTERGIINVFLPEDAGRGVLPVKAGGYTNSYTIDVTRAVNEVLARPAAQKKLRLELRLEGKPLFYEVYGVLAGTNTPPPRLEIAPDAGWSDDWEQRVAPVAGGAMVYQEACLPLTDKRDNEVVLPLLYPAKKISEVIANVTGEKLQEGRDWILRDGKLVLPAGSHAPIQLNSEFFSTERKEKDGTVKKLSTQIRLMEGTWYHERQIIVSYKPVEKTRLFPAPISTLEQLPRLKKMLTAKAPVKMILFGDSISAGGNASKFQGCWPYQPTLGELVVRKLEKQYGSKIIFMNHSRAGATSSYAVGQADGQVGWFRPDLAIIAYGMNDRSPERRILHRANIEKIIDTIRERSPETEFVVVTPMLNNPKQPAGLDPVLFIRDEALKISRPGVAFVDITTTHLELIKHKNYLDTSGNGANHPNDFLHRIYAQRILEVLLPAEVRARSQ
jgi:lysophospholipase L1-like esterase